MLRTACGLADVRMIDVLYTDLEVSNGFKMPVDTNTLIPNGTFIMFPSFNDTGLGFTASGPTAEGQDAEYGINKSVNDVSSEPCSPVAPRSSTTCGPTAR